MNEQFINDMFKAAQQSGFNGTQERFVELINTNENFRADMYGVSQQSGFGGTQDRFLELVGFGKKKVQTEPQEATSQSSESTSSDGSLVSQESVEVETPQGTEAVGYQEQSLKPISQPESPWQTSPSKDVPFSVQDLNFEKAERDALMKASEIYAENKRAASDPSLEWGSVGFAQAGGISSIPKTAPTNEDRFYQDYESAFKESLKGQIPEELKNNPEFEQQLKEKGVNLDITGEGKIGNQTITESAWNSLKKGGSDLFFTIGWLTQMGQPVYQSGIEKMKKESSEELSKKINQYERDFTGSLANGDFENASGILFNTLGESAPVMALAASTGGLGAAGGFGTLAGITGTQEYLDVKDEDWFKGMSNMEKLGYVSAVGAFEGAGEYLGGRVLRRIGKDFISKSTGGKKALGEMLKGSFKQYGVNASEEALGEAITGVGQYLSEKIAKGEDIDYAELMDVAFESAALGGAMGGGLTATKDAAAIAWNQGRVPELTQKIGDLIKEQKNASTPQQVEAVNEIAKPLIEQRNKEYNAAKKMYNSMSEEDLGRIADINLEIKEKEAYLEQVSDMPTALNQVNDEISKLEQEKNQIESRYDKEDGKRVSSEEQVGQELVEEKPKQEASQEEVGTSGVLQKEGEIKDAEKTEGTEQARLEDKGVPKAERPSDRVEERGKEPVLDEGRVGENKGYRAGDLENKAEDSGKFGNTSRGTGHFGTGFYFFGNKDKAVKHDDGTSRGISEIELSDYNLAEGTKGLHSKLKDVNDKHHVESRDIEASDIEGIASEAKSELKEESNPYDEFTPRNSKQMEALEKKYTEKEIEDGYDKYKEWKSESEKIAERVNEKLKDPKNKDTASTLVMKELGFEGVDSRKNPDLDNAVYGSVVYDIKKPVQEKEDVTKKETLSETTKETTATVKQPQGKEKIAEKSATAEIQTPKDKKSLKSVLKKVFGLDEKKSQATSTIMDRVINNIAERAGITKEAAYEMISYGKAEKAPEGSLKQEQLTWKSNAKEGLDKIQQKAATPEQWVKMISDKGGKGTTQELDWMGLSDFLKDYQRENKVKSVPKEVVEQYIADNQIEVKEVGKDDLRFKEIEVELNKAKSELNEAKKLTTPSEIDKLRKGEITEEEWKERVLGELEKRRSFDEMQRRRQASIGASDKTKYKNYQVEGGENYREVLLTMPNARLKKAQAEYEAFEKTLNSKPVPAEKMAEFNRLRDNIAKAKEGSESFTSAHWEEPNILAHIRLNERTLPNGEKVLFVEEVQSDWAQEGRKEGFQESSDYKQKKAEYDKKFSEYKLEKKKAEDKFEFLKSKYEQADKLLRENGEKLYDKYKDYVTYDMEWDSMVSGKEREYSESLLKDKERLGDMVQKAYDAKDAIVAPTKPIDSSIPDMPYKKTDQWAGMAVRRILQMAAQEGFDRVAWTRGEQIQKIVGGELEGQQYFYDRLLPKVVTKEAKRFGKDAKVEVVDFQKDLWKYREFKDRYDKILSEENALMDEVGADKPSPEQRKKMEDIDRRFERLKKEAPEGVKFGNHDEIIFPKNIDLESKGIGRQLSIPITPEMRMNLNKAVPLFQGEKGSMLAEDGKFLINALSNPNVSTPVHEIAHVYEHYLTEGEKAEIQKWAGHREWSTATSEKFARGFERYLATGKAPDAKLKKAFENFKNWLLDIYNGVKGSDIDVELSPKMTELYDTMLKSEPSSKEKGKKDTQRKTKKQSDIEKSLGMNQKKPKHGVTLKQYYTDLQSVTRKTEIEDKKKKRLFNSVTSKWMDRLIKKGKLKPSQSKQITRAASKVVDETSLEKFINTAEKISQDVNYSENLSKNRKLKANSKRNLNKRGKLGIDEFGVIGKSLRIDPELLDAKELEEYNKYLEKTSSRDKSVDVGAVSVEANNIVRKYEDRIDEQVKLTTQKNEKEVDEIEDEELTDFVLKKKEGTSIRGKDEVDESNYNFIDSLTKEDVNDLKPVEKKSLALEIKNFQDGNTTKGFYDIKRKVESKRKSDAVKVLVNDGEYRTLLRDKILNPIRDAVGKGKGKRELIFRYIKNNPLSDIDRAVKRVDQAIHNSIIEPLAIAQTKHRAFVERAEERMLDYIKMPSNPLSRKKWRDSQIKMMMIALHLENASNPNNPEVNPVKDYVKETVEYAETPRATKVDIDHAKEVQEVFDKYKNSKGEFDYDKAREDLSNKERLFMGMASLGLREAGNMEAHNAARRGDVFRKREDYMPILARYNQDLDLNEIKERSQRFFKPTTESGRTTARTKGAKPIKFIYQEAVFDAVKGASLDYHYGEPLSTTSSALSNLMKSKDLNETQKAFAGALQDAIVNVTEGVFLDNMFKGKTVWDKASRVLLKRGYQLALAGTGRAVDEFVSNAAHAVIYRPKDFYKGMQVMTKTLKGEQLSGANFRNLLDKVGSTQLSRMFSKDSTGKMMEGGWIESLGKTYYGRAVDKVADAMISTPDKVVSRTLWAGTFYNQFKKLTSEDVNVDKIIDSVEYRDKYKEEIRQSKRQADGAVIESVASTNPWEGAIASKVRAGDNVLQQFDKYMTRFARFEFASLMKGIESAVGKGRLSRKEGAALAVATIARMGIYSSILGGMGGLLPYALYSAFGGDDDEGFDKQIEKSFDLTSEKGQENWTRSFLSSAITLLLLRRLGNKAKAPITWGVEKINKEYLDFLRGGESYNPYEHSMTFSPISPQASDEEYKSKRPLQILSAFGGAYSNAIKTMDRGIVLAQRAANNKTEESRDRAKSEIYKRIIPEIIMETAGLPFAKDIRKAILLSVFESYNDSSNNRKSRPKRNN